VSWIWTTSRSTGGPIVKSSISSESKMQRSVGLLTREKAIYSCSCSQNFVRQSILARWSVIPSDLCTVPEKISRKSNWHRMNFICLKLSPWEFSWVPWFHRPPSEKPLFGFWFILHDNVERLPTLAGCHYFWAKWTDPLQNVYVV
jgi:hypothetical protein